ncbi:Cucumisin [Handroanthus impetiginosus]|uniref:Cucumisin n=1 Tax=Handroanthus impetiginosus TaxID=429701 RepID=A0A2G9GLT9_9LAMI|nr:Cucumisin [Handroanthus impetiginosus]
MPREPGRYTSTAVGSFVRGANIFGNSNGTAASMAPLAHLAICQTCSADGCFESDILAALDAAIEDGIDVISISFGLSAMAFDEDYIRGIFVSWSARNRGPFHTTLSNEAPWILTVCASTIDKNLRATAILGNRMELNGESSFQTKGLPLGQLPLVYPGMNASDFGANYCLPESLNSTYVKRKVVLCTVDSTPTKTERGRTVKNASGVAIILMNMEHEGFTTSADAHVILATNVNYEDGLKIIAYVNSTSIPIATIVFKGTIMGDQNAPTVASFSSKGPSYVSRGILKLDIIGPGVNILAAWPNSIENNANTKNNFNIISGTSVSSPHLSGHVNPTRVSDPGLVYDIEPHDYIPYLCGLNYTSREVTKIFLHRVNCSAESRIPEGQLNYPSFANGIQPSHQRFTRTVTNVGENNESYQVEAVLPQGFDIFVNPRTLNFLRLNKKLTYEVTFRRSGNPGNTSVSQGYIIWKSSKLSVRSPIAACEL